MSSPIDLSSQGAVTTRRSAANLRWPQAISVVGGDGLAPMQAEQRDWNSIGMPVTTPIAKFRPKIRIQNRAPPFQRSPPARRPSVFVTTMSRARPIVSWENRQVVAIDDGERELQPVPDERVRHRVSLRAVYLTRAPLTVGATIAQALRPTGTAMESTD